MIEFSVVEFETSFGVWSQVPKSSCPEIVFVGRSNVGKSSLVNKLFNRKKLARVSSMPGKTTTINFYKASNLRFVDLPGYGYAKAPKKEKARWSILINKYFADVRNICLVFLLLDIRHKPSENDLLMLDLLVKKNLTFIVILTKADKIAKTKVTEQVEIIKKHIKNSRNFNFIPFSSVTGQGVLELKEVMGKVCVEESSSIF